MKSATLTALFALTTSFAAGCDDPSGFDDLGDVAFRSPPCIGCGPLGNSPEVNDFPVPEINLGGFNNQGVRVRSVRSPSNTPYNLTVTGDQLVARTFVFGQGWHTIAQGAGLIGWRIELEGPNGVIDFMYITGHAELTPWATGPHALTAYALAYDSDPSGTVNLANVCPGAASNQAAVTLIKGETYDRDLILVNPGMTNWVTLACEEEAAFKMKRLTYGPNDTLGTTGVAATVDQRQATLKMLTADYCGTGDPYTIQGFPLKWKNRSNTAVNWSTSTTIEARWDADGATCLSRPRVALFNEVTCSASLPPCPTISPFQNGEELVSGFIP